LDSQDGSDAGVFGRRWNASGVAIGVEFQVNVYTPGSQTIPAVAVDSSGDFVVAWSDTGLDGNQQGVFARRFSAAGVALDVAFQVNSYTQLVQFSPAVDLEPDGDFVVAWISPQDGSGYGIMGQRFSSAGVRLGPEFQINSHFTFDQVFPAVAAEADGDFTVVWASEGQDGSGDSVVGRRFDSSGAPQAEFQVNQFTNSDQTRPAIAGEPDGDFWVVWDSAGQDGHSRGIVARRFKESRLAASGEFVVNTITQYIQTAPAVAADLDGDFVVAWMDEQLDPPNQSDVKAQRFDLASVIDVDGDGQYLPLTDGLLLLRFGFGFTGNILIAGAVGEACTRCDAAAIGEYLQSLL
jgi:hypothetical protein